MPQTLRPPLTVSYYNPPQSRYSASSPTWRVRYGRRPSGIAQAVTAPFLGNPQLAPIHPHRQNRIPYDTSYGMPKSLFGDAQQPVFNPAQEALDLPRFVADTSQDSPVTLLLSILAPAPFVNPVFAPIARRIDTDETSQSTPSAILAGLIPAPFAQLDWQAPIARRVVAYGTDVRVNVSTAPPTAVFPTPGQVLAGVVYGPNGTDYTGTLVQSTGGSAYLRRR